MVSKKCKEFCIWILEFCQRFKFWYRDNFSIIRLNTHHVHDYIPTAAAHLWGWMDSWVLQLSNNQTIHRLNQNMCVRVAFMSVCRISLPKNPPRSRSSPTRCKTASRWASYLNMKQTKKKLISYSILFNKLTCQFCINVSLLFSMNWCDQCSMSRVCVSD